MDDLYDKLVGSSESCSSDDAFIIDLLPHPSSYKKRVYVDNMNDGTSNSIVLFNRAFSGMHSPYTTSSIRQVAEIILIYRKVHHQFQTIL